MKKPTPLLPPPAPNKQLRQTYRRYFDRLAYLLCGCAAWLGVLIAVWLLVDLARRGFPWWSTTFFTEVTASRYPGQAGFLNAIWGSVFMMLMITPVAFFLAVGTALYLEEYARPGRMQRLIQLNLSNLSAVPSVVYGMLGLTLFVRALGMGQSILAGALTLALMVLPLIVVAAREAIRGIPLTLREASYAMGATQWQTIRHVVLPAAFPGIATGMLLAIARAAGETAPLILIGAVTFLSHAPLSPLDNFTSMPIQIYNWISRPEEAFHHLAAAGILLLLLALLVLNVVALYIRERHRS